MFDRDDAPRCQSLARGWAFTRIQVAAAAVALGLTLVAFVPAATAQGCPGAHTPIAAASRHQLQRSAVCLINQQRRRHHLPRLHASRRLNRSAQGWTNRMVRSDIFSHGVNFAARISAVGFHWSMVGENIASGFATPAAVVRAWMASAGHCENILSPSFAAVGTGVSGRSIPGSGGAGAWTQDFGLPMGQHPPSGNGGPARGCPYRI
jgi:uncharacterized protein YkwD